MLEENTMSALNIYISMGKCNKLGYALSAACSSLRAQLTTHSLA